MSKLITKGNLAIFEYPAGGNNPTFELDKDGVFWVGGFKSVIFPFLPAVNCMKRYELKLIGYVIVGSYEYASKKIKNSFDDMISEGQVDKDRCIIMIKK